jgi:type IV pilus assembly protein PilB
MSEPGDRFGHLRPVPPVSGSEALEPAPEEGGTPGLTPPRTRTHSGRFITDVVVELGYLTRERVDQAIGEARVAGRSPEALMVDQGILSADQLSRAVAERYGLDHVDLNVFHVDMGAANLVSVQTARRFHAVPVSYVDPETLLVAMADPANVLAVDDMQMMTGLNCRVAVAAEVDIEALISRLNSLESAVSEAISEDEEEAALSGADVTELRESADDAPVIKLVYSILGQAVNEGASDVHFEIEEKDMRVRFRVDGVLNEAARVPRRMVAGVISRVKIMSELDIAEKRVPQDGRVAVNVNDRRVDLRVVTVPTERGEGATIRILDKTEALRTLDELGFTGDARRNFTDAYSQPYGAVLVTGPTGSGKSTTLYSALAELNNVAKNIITIEDPVEYQLPGINQMGVNRKAGLDFATGLRSILRADPDVIMVGEVRDPETARIAVEAALTGHMVLTTLHTNDAPSAVTRLAKMGIESFLTASAVDCVVAQRLARTLCPDCKRRTVLERAALEEA